MARKSLISFTEYTFPNYQTAQLHRQIAEQLDRVERGDVDRLMLLVPPRYGKLCADDTPILTTRGWVTHGELCCGDFVYAPDGKAVEVVAISPPGIADHVVRFTNGEAIQCHANHEWFVRFKPQRTWSVRETKYFIGPTIRTSRRALWTGNRGKRGGRTLFHVQDICAVKGVEQTFAINPYALGVWLGDGTTTAPNVTMSVDDIEIVVSAFASVGYPASTRWVHSSTKVPTVSFGSGTPNVRGIFAKALNAYSLLKNKHIPGVFFTGTVDQRLELLAGLIDTDGYVDKNGRVVITTGDSILAEDIYRLCASLAFRPYITKIEPTTSSSGIVGKKLIYVIGFQPNLKIPTRLPRKWCGHIKTKRRLIGITDVEKCAPKIGRCIQVNSTDGMYLIGKTLIPTHNSELASRRFPGYYLGRHPSHQFISASATAALAGDFGRDVRNLIASEEYAKVFDTRLSEDNTAKGCWTTQQGGKYYAVGIGGAIMGRGAHVLLIDDPFADMASARSPVARKEVWHWYTGTAYNRLEQNGAIVVINHRMHEDDLSGMLLSEQAAGGDQWEVVELKAIDDDGHALWPEKYDLTALERIRRNTMPAYWSALYQQNPTPDEGTFFLADWFKPYVEVPDRRTLQVYGASDYAVTDDGGDYTVHAVVGVDPEDRIYLLDMWRGRTGPDEWIEAWCDLVLQWKPLGWAEETGQITKSIGPFRNKRAAERKSYVACATFPTSGGDKSIRAQSIRGRAAMRGLYVPVHAKWYPEFRSEMLSFPAGRNDDIVDVMGLIGQIIDRMVPGRALPRSTEPKILNTHPDQCTVTLNDVWDSQGKRRLGGGRIR